MTALAHLHAELVRSAFARALAVRRTWAFGRAAVGFGGVAGAADAEEGP
jgi:hypothetical protein